MSTSNNIACNAVISGPSCSARAARSVSTEIRKTRCTQSSLFADLLGSQMARKGCLGVTNIGVFPQCYTESWARHCVPLDVKLRRKRQARCNVFKIFSCNSSGVVLINTLCYGLLFSVEQIVESAVKTWK